MKKISIVLLVAVLTAGAVLILSRKATAPVQPTKSGTTTPVQQVGKEDTPATMIIAENLDTPWALAILPEGNMLVTERFGRVMKVDGNKQNEPVVIATIADVKEIGEGGLLGIAVHPEFETKQLVYVYYTYSNDGNNTLNRVERYRYYAEKLTDKNVIVDAIPGANFHNGGRIKFGPDGFLYITTGDAQEPSLAQDRSSLAGKILRVTDEGKAAPGNPFNTPVYSYGHRNPQGLAWNGSDLFEVEHGSSMHDELNSIEAGANYGWPTITGTETRDGMKTPLLESGNNTWAPSGAAFLNGSVFFGGLRSEVLYEAVTENGQVKELKEHFKGELGRIRDVVATQDGLLYITTSNKDGRGTPQVGDDKIIRINPGKL